MFRFSLCFIMLVFLASCAGKQNTADQSDSLAVSSNTPLDKQPIQDLKKLIVGTWSTTETASGESLVFAGDGTYSGYDGRSEFSGTWTLKENKLNLSLGGESEIKIAGDSLYIGSVMYLRDQIKPAAGAE
jgi:heat shock protein HslJ